MGNKIKGLTIEIGGETTALNKALGEVNKHSRDLKSELKDVERLLKLDPTNTELLSQKQKILAESISNTKTKLDTLKDAEKQAQEQFKQGKIGEEQYRAIQREVIKTEEELKKMNKQLKEMDWKKTAEGLDSFGKKATTVGKTLSTTVTAPILGVGIASFKMAADLEDAFGATDQIFKGASEGVKAWADSLPSYYGIAEGEALGYATTMGAMLQNIGKLGEEEAAKQSGTLIELAGDLAAMFGGTTESAVQALTGALKGNTSMLDNYGMGVNDATIKTKALEMGLYDGTGTMDLASKQAATLALIMEQTADAQGQAGREAEGASGSMRALVTELKNLATDIGEVLLPIITPFIAALKDMAAGFGELSPTAQTTIVVIAGIAAAIGPLLIVLGSMATGLSSIITLVGGAGGFSAVLAAVTGPIGIAIAAVVAVTAVIVALWKTNEDFRDNVKKIWDQIKDIFDKTLTAIKSVVETVYNAIMTFWNSNSEKIRSVTQTVWDAIGLVFNTVLTFISGVVTAFINNIQTFWGKFGDDIKNLTDTAWNLIESIIETVIGIIKGIITTFIGLVTGDWGTFTDGLKTVWSTMWDGIKKIVEGAWELLSSAFALLYEGISGWFIGLIEDALEWGSNLVEGLWDGISGAAGWLYDKVAGFVEGIADKVTDFFGIASPSKLMAGYGKNIDEGLAEGITDNEIIPLNAIQSVGEKMATAASKAAKTVMDLLTITDDSYSISGPAGTVSYDRKSSSKAYSDSKQSDLTKYADEIAAIANKHNVDMSVGYEMFKSNELDKIYGREETYKSSSKSSGITQNITVNSPKALSPSEAAKTAMKAAQKMLIPLLR